MDSNSKQPPNNQTTAGNPPGTKKVILPASVRYDNKHLKLERYDVLPGDLSEYLVQKLLGCGSFGQVVQCVSLKTKEKVAVKIMQKHEGWAGKKEVGNLNVLKELDKDKNNLVKFIEHFEHKGHFCLTFELLDITLDDLLEKMSDKPLHLSEIRLIAQQMLVALNALKSVGLAHLDIKPNNIMLINHQLQPFKVKLIDFGLAIPVSKIYHGTIVQRIGYRAPEVILGLPWNEAVDMWSLGCVLAFTYLSQHPYPLYCKLEVLKVIIQMQGQPDDHMLNSGIYTRDFFSKIQDSTGPSWKLKTECEFPCCMDDPFINNRPRSAFDMFTSFDDMAKTRPEVNDTTECEDTRAFLSLLKRMLHVDPAKRVTPSEALGHRFITMKHFARTTDPDPYVSAAYLAIKECQLEEPSVTFKRFITSSETLSMSGESPSTSGLDEGCDTADRAAAADRRPSGEAGLDDTIVAATAKEPPGMAGTIVPSDNVDKSHLQIDKYDVLSGKQGRYLVQKLVGEGAYGHVIQCIKLDTKEKMAVKIVKKDEAWAGKKELAMLKQLSELDRDKNNLVRFTEHFLYKGHVCLVFEMLHVSIEDFVERITLKPLQLSDIRVIAEQMLVALNALKGIGLAHTDIKPDNIMLVNQRLQPFKVKLIDFGLAIPVNKMRTGTIMQVIGYRAPEVILGLPLSEAIDMWSLGCILAYMYLGQDPFPLHCEHEVMRRIIQVQGQPNDHMLSTGTYTQDFFTPSPWKLKTKCTFKCCENRGSRTNMFMGALANFTSLNDLARTVVKDTIAYQDTQAFLSLLKQMLHVDPEKRITPSEALNHSFITKIHLSSDTNSKPHTSMKECQLEDLAVRFQRLKTFSKVSSWNGSSISNCDDSLAVDVENVTSTTTDESQATGGAAETPAAADTTTADNNSYSQGSKDTNFPMEEYDVLSGKVSAYLIETFRCEGHFGKLAQCIRLDTKEKIAVKIVKKGALSGKREVAMLKKLRTLDHDKNNLVKFTEHFEHKGHICLAFEMLDMSIKDLIEKTSLKALHLSEIRVITQQMLVALNALAELGVAHANINPNKIMLVNHQLQPFKVKLTDFGRALPVSKIHPGIVMQAVGYRAPEVILGLALNEAIDMWGLGCVLAYMYLGRDLYPLNCEHEVMRVIIQLLGQPGNHMLNLGIYTRALFSKTQDSTRPSWKLKTECTFPCCKPVEGFAINHRGAFDTVTSFDDIAKSHPEVTETTEDTRAFLSILKRMLQVDPEKRISPREALGHCFITMKHPPTDANLSSGMSSQKDKANTCSNYGAPATADRIAARVNNRPEAVKNPPTKNEGTSTACVSHKSNGDNTDTDEGATGFVEVKTRKKYFTRIRGFFSQMFKKIRCCKVDATE